MDILRFAHNLVSVDKLMVYRRKKDGIWLACNDEKIGTRRLKALYEFLHCEQKKERIIFSLYVDEVLDELIYNKYGDN